MATPMSRRFNSDLEGCRVLLRMIAGDVEGTVHNVSPDSSRLSLVETTDVDSGLPIPGILYFYGQDIASCVVLDNTSRKKQVVRRDEDGPRLLRVRPLPAHLEQLNASVNNCEFICHIMEGDNSEEVKKGIIQLMGSPDKLPKLQQPLATEFEVIDQVNNRFNKAMATIRNVRSISIGFEGPEVSRCGSISVLAVATSTKVFIFDVINLKEELFNRGLREVLESNDIEKVIHGCRHLSDCLHHRYKVGLNNVFDTMVADIVIYYNKKLDAGQQYLPQFVRSIQNCLRSFLNLTQEQLKYTRSQQGQQEVLVCTWEQRPLTLGQIDALVKNTVYLAELARACLKQLLLRFQLGVQFFLKLQRDCSAQELDCLPPDHILPAGFKDALKCSAVLSGTHRHCANYDQDCYREYGRYGKSGEYYRFQHRGQQRRRDNGHYRRDQDRDDYMESRGSRSQGDVIRGQRSGGGGSELLGEATKVDDSLMLVAMRHQDRNRDDKPGDTTAQVPMMAYGHASHGVGARGAVNRHCGNNALSGADYFSDSAGENSEESEEELLVCNRQRTERKRNTEVGNNGEVAPADMLMFAGTPTTAAPAVQKTLMAAGHHPSNELLITNANRGEEVFRSTSCIPPLREWQSTSPDLRAKARQGSPGLPPHGWGTRPTKDEYKEMSFRPADMQVRKHCD